MSDPLDRNRPVVTGSVYGGMPFHIFEFCWRDRHVNGALDEIQHWRLRTYLQNGDQESAFKFLAEIRKLRMPEPNPKECEIAKIGDGTHYYVLGTKFNTEDEARRHALRLGYQVVRVFTADGSGANAAALRRVLTKPEKS